MIELERTFLAKSIPENLLQFKSKEVIDIYYPLSHPHPTLRLRKNGEKYEMTKKEPIGGSTTEMLEQTIKLRKDEFDEFSKIPGKKVHKIRYFYPHEGVTAEIGVFQGDLRGLVLVDFEFKDKNEKDSFVMPDFCLAEIKHEEGLAGGMLCGKKIGDVQSILDKYNYKKIEF